MEKTYVYKNFARLNGLSAKRAEAAFLDCCGSTEWARRMAADRPFQMLEDLYKTAEKIWFDLPPAEMLEAFAAHPKIGSSNPPRSQKRRAAKWSDSEQSGVNGAGKDVMTQLAELNSLYHEKFGFIFIICATGKTVEEMLAICKARLRNSAATELKIAAEEQMKITDLRLNKLLEK